MPRGTPLKATVHLLVLALLAGVACTVCAAEVLVVMPDVREPYRSILQQIADGIRQTADTRLELLPAGSALALGNERVLIALGSAAVEAAAPLASRLPVVTGAIVSPAGQPPLPGISLEPDPEALFAQLLKLRPGVRRVHWIYRPERSDWLLPHAQAAARKLRIDLVVHAADDARTASQTYQDILRRADNTAEAVWLGQDPALIGTDANLPDILGLAWSHNVIVFSGSLQHVANGVLFALFPDNTAMGADLARLALACAGGKTAGFLPNRALRRAINRRTAEHLGLPLDAQQFDVVLPAR